MDRKDFDEAIDQLAAAADLVVSDQLTEEKMSLQQLRAFFRLQQARRIDASARRTSDDELFKSTAIAALTMAGRKEYPAAAALLEQARSLIQN